MRLKNLLTLTATLIILAMPAYSNEREESDTDVRLVKAKVVEVTDARVSVIARSGIEHVIAVDGSDTKVSLDGKHASIKELREGDVVTIELDELNPLKFAKNIRIANPAGQQVASVP